MAIVVPQPTKKIPNTQKKNEMISRHRKNSLLLLLITSTLAASCAFSPLTWRNGIKKPKQLSNEELVRYLQKYNHSKTLFLIPKSKKDYSTLINQQYSRIPDAMFFNRHKQFIPYRENPESCGISPVDFAISLLPELHIQADTLQLHSIINQLCWSHDGSPVNMQELPQADYYVLLFWAKFAGKLNKKVLVEWHEGLQSDLYPGLSLVKLWVNMDPQTSWNYREEE